MVVMIVTCDACNKELSYPIDEMPTISAEITITEHRAPCEKCYHSEDIKTKYYFCSVKCMRRWVKRFNPAPLLKAGDVVVGSNEDFAKALAEEEKKLKKKLKKLREKEHYRYLPTTLKRK